MRMVVERGEGANVGAIDCTNAVTKKTETGIFRDCDRNWGVLRWKLYLGGVERGA